ncbi:hypothetical protein Pmani_024195 [Petrolisthes manimaculis]|uniref:Uncharacterized protein n=1 Tax=Petrolisthes manimaculis TaxID=1843537 RepID=A0AAE1P818_9EUCA|nr:hypothetical protein Pmani_024195 [Petrolisthes manimaculis]
MIILYSPRGEWTDPGGDTVIIKAVFPGRGSPLHSGAAMPFMRNSSQSAEILRHLATERGWFDRILTHEDENSAPSFMWMELPHMP